MAGITYIGKVFHAEAWYYDISNSQALGAIANKSLYFSLGVKHLFSDEILLHVHAQYLKQNSKDESLIEAAVYGALAEVDELVFGFAYNKSQKKSSKGSFSGFGGGVLYTNMDNMILDNISYDADAVAMVGGVSYKVGDFEFLYANGDFYAKANSFGAKEHVVEQNIGFDYSMDDALSVAFLYVSDEYKSDTQTLSDIGKQKTLRLLLTYNF